MTECPLLKDRCRKGVSGSMMRHASEDLSRTISVLSDWNWQRLWLLVVVLVLDENDDDA